MHNDCCRRLLRNKLICLGELNTNCAADGEQLEDLRVIFQIGDSRIAPAVATPAGGVEAKFTANDTIGVFGERFCHLNTETMDEVGFCIVACLLQAMNDFACRLAHCHHLKGNHIDLAALHRGKVVGETEPFTLILAGEAEACDLMTRAALLQRLRVIDDQLITTGLTGEVAIDCFWLQVALLTCLAQHPLETRTKLLLNQTRELCSVRFATPLHAIECVEVHAFHNVFKANAFQYTWTPEWRSGERERRFDTCRRGLGAFDRACLIPSCSCFFLQSLA